MYFAFVICIVDLKSSVELVFYVCCDMYRLKIKLYFFILFIYNTCTSKNKILCTIYTEATIFLIKIGSPSLIPFFSLSLC